MKSYEERRGEFLPWTVENRETPAQAAIQAELLSRRVGEIGENCFISELADIFDAELHLGRDTVIGANALIRSAILRTGENCSVNSYAYLQGDITLGDEVRIGPAASIIASNHGHYDITRTIREQDLCEKGIRVGDDVWIGANSVLVDGVTVGSHSIIAAGAVVTKPVGDYVIVGGNPARVLKNRIEHYFADRLASFFDRVTPQISPLVAGHYRGGEFVDSSVNQAPVRALCDAAELLAMFGAEGPIPKEQMLGDILARQTPEIDYRVLCIGYALEALGGAVARPYPLPPRIPAWLDALPWNENAWGAGDSVDCLGTAIYQNTAHFGQACAEKELAELFAWLGERVNPRTGLWGEDEEHRAVNGFYRLTRGTYAQFNRPLPLPERAVDSILRHAASPELFEGKNGTACDVLDVIHPLWLCKKQTLHRFDEGRRWAFLWIDKIIVSWSEGCGFSFDLLQADNPTLMGTEMWFSILYYLCDYIGIAPLLPYTPKGVHRP